MENLIPENTAKKIDNLGRITLPKGLRDRMFLKNEDEMEIFTAQLDGRQCICLSKPIDKNEELRAAIDFLTSNGFEVKKIEEAIEENILLNDLMYLARNFYKVIEYNKEEDSYFEVKSDGEKKVFKNLRHWVEEFEKVGVWEEDRDRFERFFEDFKRVYYRRKIGDSWRWVCMEAIEIADEIILLVVRDVEDYIVDYKEQIV